MQKKQGKSEKESKFEKNFYRLEGEVNIRIKRSTKVSICLITIFSIKLLNYGFTRNLETLEIINRFDKIFFVIQSYYEFLSPLFLMEVSWGPSALWYYFLSLGIVIVKLVMNLLAFYQVVSSSVNNNFMQAYTWIRCIYFWVFFPTLVEVLIVPFKCSDGTIRYLLHVEGCEASAFSILKYISIIAMILNFYFGFESLVLTNQSMSNKLKTLDKLSRILPTFDTYLYLFVTVQSLISVLIGEYSTAANYGVVLINLTFYIFGVYIFYQDMPYFSNTVSKFFGAIFGFMIPKNLLRLLSLVLLQANRNYQPYESLAIMMLCPLGIKFMLNIFDFRIRYINNTREELLEHTVHI
jgi:hypothetical protein